MHAASSLHHLQTLPRIQNSFALSPIFMLRDLHNIGALVPTTTAMLYSPHMDKDTKDILETVNFILIRHVVPQFGEGGDRFRLATRDCALPKRAHRVGASGALCLGETLAHGIARKIHNRATDPFLAGF
jgi:hypothetical protein